MRVLLLGIACSIVPNFALATKNDYERPPFSIEVTEVRGSGCPHPDEISVDLSPTGNYFIVAQFNNYDDHFLAVTSPDTSTARVNCTIQYNLILDEGYRLDYAEFYIDGEYHLSENGTAFFSIRHNVPGVDQPVFHNMSRSAFDDDKLSDNFQLFGSIEGIDKRANYCGATIPIEVQLRATARRAFDDSFDTFVGVDNAEGEMGERQGRQQIDCFGRVISCD
ncbi:DUF4360 domain-containing protein [Pseudobacteriovorax antillogorgiicola]|uniref:DUF4360 domain-containing protein n=1 Tax=Pseudobacteriovorax antillogorgiicola TaxID=1513793 RepID=A0A1Y6CLS9_9BACT|nr:DUF4360 domain-containing protein [Pseudobacteriovorax antillogorgiicola]TCS45614.1 uncharacterized protein DUF4360 [Pseudobacteriovorax antillogorgiicola]SMF72369.1 protein of unknown function [Pseudobacteriovorax antillogorgiicola]